jgi:hypothetical protein
MDRNTTDEGFRKLQRVVEFLCNRVENVDSRTGDLGADPVAGEK